MNNGYFPIGTLITLKNATKPVMIMATPSFKDNIKYDYLGVMFPIGYAGDDFAIYFNKDQIKSVQFIGFEDSISNNYIKSLNNQGGESND